MFQGGNAAQHGQLHIFRQAGVHALYIDFARAPALRLQKDLMSLFIGKTHDLIFDRWAIARTNAFDDTCIERRTVQVLADDPVHRRVRLGHPAEDLRIGNHLVTE